MFHMGSINTLVVVAKAHEQELAESCQLKCQGINPDVCDVGNQSLSGSFLYMIYCLIRTDPASVARMNAGNRRTQCQTTDMQPGTRSVFNTGTMTLIHQKYIIDFSQQPLNEFHR